MVDRVMQFDCGQNTGDTFTRVYMYNFQNIVLCFRNNIKLWKIAVFIQNNFQKIRVCRASFLVQLVTLASTILNFTYM